MPFRSYRWNNTYVGIMRYFSLFVSLILLLLSCNREPVFQWHRTAEGYYVWADEKDSLLTYSWDGETISNVAHGMGLLTISKYGTEEEQKRICLQYGAKLSDIKTTTEGQSYIGRTEDGVLSGFAVLINGKEVYIGNFSKSRPNGKLDLYKNGKLYYSGEWKDGVITGFGTLYPGGSEIMIGRWEEGKLVETNATIETNVGRYSGQLVDDMPNGYGIMDYSSGANYEGEWKNSKWEGDGVLTTPFFKYSGEWSNGLPDGIGLIQFADSTYFEGNWTDGRRDGYGDCLFVNKDYYSGEWSEDLPNGEGTYYYADGSEYYGTWEDGLQHGQGCYRSSKIEYEGDWEEGWANGKGRAEYINGDIYEGNFVENERYGQGVYFYANGNSYEGEFVDDTFNGLGIFHFNDGSRYEGEFVAGKIFGDGTYYYKDDDGFIAVTANWDGSDSFPETASILFPNGDIFEGRIINGIPSSDGIWMAGEKSKLKDFAAKASDFYSTHEKTIHNVVMGVSVGLTVVAVVATPGGWVAATAVAINTTINVLDAASSIANEAYNGNYSAAVGEVALNVAFIAAPAVLKKPARKAAAVLSPIAKKTGRAINNGLVVIGKTKPFRKIVQITREQTGRITKRIVKTSGRSLKRSSGPVKKYKSWFLSQRLAKTLLQKELDAIKKKGAIKLTATELMQLSENPKEYIRHFILAKTGDKKNFQEFFIRLAMGDKAQVKQLLDIQEIRKYVDNSIRHYSGGGGMHEWLLTSNFQDYLLNPKWGDDGPYLAMALTKLIQKTKAINFKNGFGHPAAGRPNTSASVAWHNELARRIANCSSKEELFLAVKKYARETLDKGSYEEFRRIFWDVFSIAK